MKSSGKADGLDAGLLLVRVVLGGLFIVTGWAKIATPLDTFSNIVMRYDMLPKGQEHLAGIVAIFLPWIEVVAGVCILVGIWGRGGALVAGVMMLLFTAAKAQAVARGIPLGDCGCFPAWMQEYLELPNWYGVGLNGVWLVLALLLLVGDVGALRLDRVFARRKRGNGATAAVPPA